VKQRFAVDAVSKEDGAAAGAENRTRFLFRNVGVLEYFVFVEIGRHMLY